MKTLGWCGVVAIAIGALVAPDSVAVADDEVRTYRSVEEPAIEVIETARIFDTRAGSNTVDGIGQAAGRFSARTAVRLPIGGRAGIPASATAAWINVVAVGATAPGYIVVYPCAEQRPATSSLNFLAGQVRSNGVVTALSNGAACVWSLVDVDLVVDAQAYVARTNDIWTRRHQSFNPVRLVDTRQPDSPWTGGLAAGSIGLLPGRDIAELRQAAVATDSVILNVTATNAVAAGHLRVGPCERVRELSSVISYTPGESVAGLVIVPNRTYYDDVCVYTSGRVDVIVDVTGFTTLMDGYSASFNEIQRGPARIYDSRQSGAGRVRAASPRPIQVAGRGDFVFEVVVPSGASEAFVAVTVTGATRSGWLKVQACDAEPDSVPTSSLNFAAGQTVSNLVATRLDEHGDACVTASTDVDVIIDAYAAPTGGIEDAGFIDVGACGEERSVSSVSRRALASGYSGEALTSTATFTRVAVFYPGGEGVMTVNVPPGWTYDIDPDYGGIEFFSDDLTVRTNHAEVVLHVDGVLAATLQVELRVEHPAPGELPPLPSSC